MNTQLIDVSPKKRNTVTTHSHSRAVSFAREQYRYLKNSEKAMNVAMEMVKKVGHEDYHQKAFYEALGRFQTASILMDNFCAAFGIEMQEIDPRAAV